MTDIGVTRVYRGDYHNYIAVDGITCESMGPITRDSVTIRMEDFVYLKEGGRVNQQYIVSLLRGVTVLYDDQCWAEQEEEEHHLMVFDSISKAHENPLVTLRRRV